MIFVVENVFKTTQYEDFADRFNKAFYDTVFPKKQIKTYSIKEALDLSKKKPKKMLVNIYTGFCNSCKVQNKTTKSYAYEITNPKEYQDLKALIDNALQECIAQIHLANSPQDNHIKKTTTKPTKPVR